MEKSNTVAPSDQPHGRESSVKDLPNLNRAIPDLVEDFSRGEHFGSISN